MLKDYTTIEDLENYLLIEIDPAFESQIKKWIEIIEAYIDRYTGRNFKAESEGNALSFDGIDDYVLIPDDNSLDFHKGNFSFEFLLKSDSEDNCNLNAKFDAGVGFRFGLEASPDKVSFTLGATVVSYNFDWNDNKWHHIVGVREGLEIKLYIDGGLKNTQAIPNDTVDNSVGLYLGADGVGSYYKGLLDEVRVYSRALSAKEVNEHYADIFTNETNLVGYWDFNFPNGIIAFDNSVEGNDGTIYGAVRVKKVVPYLTKKYEIDASPDTFGTQPDYGLFIDECVEIVSLKIDGVEVPASEYLAYPVNSTPKTRIKIKDTSSYMFTKGEQNIEVKAKWGYSEEVPPDISFITTVFVAGIINYSLQHEGEVASESIGNYSVSYKTETQWQDFNRALVILDGYKKII